MGMDGLSMASTGMLREATSRDFANKTEESIHKDDGLKQVDQLQTQMRVKEDGHNKQDQDAKKKKEKDEDASYFEETEEELHKKNAIEFSQEELENNSFYVKITKDGDIFELYDKKSNRLVEKISAEEINDLISKLNMASGILVNRTV